MKELLINIITKIINYTKVFINEIINKIKFASNKNVIIKVMYNSILEKKIEERNKLLLEISNIKKQAYKQNSEINIVKEENTLYNKKMNALNSFQMFLLDNQN